MFTLFNAIFMLVFAFALVMTAISLSSFDDDTVQLAIQLGWLSLLGLPGLAVAVRRLHDLGKSGWMVFVALIPIVGGIWLLILMCTDGQTGANRFGPDPKTSPEAFGDKAKLTSVGIALIVASSLVLIHYALLWSFPQVDNNYWFSPLPILSKLRIFLTPVMIFMTAIFLLRSTTREQARPAMWMVLATGCYLLAINVIPAMFGENTYPVNIFYNVVNLASALALVGMAASQLFAPQNRNAVRGWAMVVMVTGGLFLLSWFLSTALNGLGLQTISEFFNLLLALGASAWIVLAWTFFSRRGEFAAATLEDSSVAESLAPDMVPGLAATDVALSGDEALIHLYRPGRMAGAMIGYDVYLDDRIVWRAKNGSKTTVRVAREGTVMLMAKTESRKELPLDVRAGCEYYVRCGMKIGVAVGRPKLELMDNAAGKAEFDRT